jgi:hypothetical protein
LTTFQRNIPPLRWGQKQDGGTRFTLNIWNHLWLNHSVTQKPQYKYLWPQKPKLKTSHIINLSPTKSYHFFNFMTLCSLENILMGIRNFMVNTVATKNWLTVLQTKLDSWWHICWTRQSAAGYQRSHKDSMKRLRLECWKSSTG